MVEYYLGKTKVQRAQHSATRRPVRNRGTWVGAADGYAASVYGALLATSCCTDNIDGSIDYFIETSVGITPIFCMLISHGVAGIPPTHGRFRGR